METYRDKLSDKFKEIKNQFGYMTNYSNKKRIKKNYSHLNLITRLRLPKTKHKSIDKPDLSHLLEQIGGDELIFNNDKLITNIKIESFENNLKKNSIMSVENDRSFISKKSNKTNSTSINRRKNNRQDKDIKFVNNRNKIKEYSNISNMNSKHNSLELNCNKLPFTNGINKKKINGNGKINRKNKSINKNKNGCKNVEQFINKRNDAQKTLNQNILLTPINKSSTRVQNNKRILKHNDFHSTQRSFINFNNNDTISLASASRIDMSKSYIRGRSMPSRRPSKMQSNLRLPNKSIIKNQDKIITELQKLFGEKIQLTDDIYQNMTELDKKNCINFLLETVKELHNINKISKSKTDGYKQIIESKDNDIKNYKNEIKELKKDSIKLNKVIKTNNQLNKKLSQSIDNLKLQLEKEKAKNKTFQTRGKSTNKIYSNRYRKENSINKNKKHREIRSQDKLERANEFINKKNNENNNEKKRNSSINNKENDLQKNNNIDKNKINIIWKNKEKNKDDKIPTINHVLSIDNEKKNEENNENKSENLLN